MDVSCLVFFWGNSHQRQKQTQIWKTFLPSVILHIDSPAVNVLKSLGVGSYGEMNHIPIFRKNDIFYLFLLNAFHSLVKIFYIFNMYSARILSGSTLSLEVCEEWLMIISCICHFTVRFFTVRGERTTSVWVFCAFMFVCVCAGGKGQCS